MLYDALLTLDLPRTVGPPLPTPFWDGVPRLLFTGSWARRAATCTLSSAAVLAGCHAVLRAVGHQPAFRIVDDAGELLDLSAVPERWGDAPEPRAEVLPPRWTSEPCAFRLRASWEEGGFAAVALLRYTPRHDVEQAALSGSVRVLWTPEEPGPRLAVRLERPDIGLQLSRRLRTHGDRVVQATADGLGERFGGTVAHRSRVVALVEAETSATFDELLDGFPEPALRSIAPIRGALRGTWPALAADGVEGRWSNGRFVPSAEVDPAV